MARKRTMKTRKLEPAVQTLAFNVPNGTNTIDLSQCASLANRRFYRQGINWVIAGFRFFRAGTAPTAGTGVSVSKLPNTWVLGNAWEKAFRHWQKLNKKALEAGESLPGRFTDFKIYMDDVHFIAGKDANLRPIDSAGNVAQAGEWVYSTMVIPDSAAPGTTIVRDIIAVGANYPGPGSTGNNAVSLIEGYAASRALPSVTDPNTPDDAQSIAGGPAPQNWLGALDNEGNTQTDQVITDLTSDNDQAPYPFENGEIPIAPGTFWNDTQYPGGANQLPALQVVDTAYFSTAENANKLYCKGDNFPCGLVRIFQNTGEQIQMLIDLVPGTHRGYLCEPMTEM